MSHQALRTSQEPEVNLPAIHQGLTAGKVMLSSAIVPFQPKQKQIIQGTHDFTGTEVCSVSPPRHSTSRTTPSLQIWPTFHQADV